MTEISPNDTRAPTALVPFDFSPSAGAALTEAIRWATRFGWRLLLLHVVHDPAQAPGFYLETPPVGDGSPASDKREKKGRKMRKARRKHVRTMTSAADEMLAECVLSVEARLREAAPDVVCDRRLEVGTPAHRIVEVADEEGVVHIIMGTRGLGPLGGVLLGSTAQRVVRLAQVPVTLVKAARG